MDLNKGGKYKEGWREHKGRYRKEGEQSHKLSALHRTTDLNKLKHKQVLLI